MPPENDQLQIQSLTIMTVDGSTIQGKVYLHDDDRMSDLFTKSESPFLIMVNAVSRDVQDKTLFINKDHIIWVEPEET